jgi:hypothetical protein
MKLLSILILVTVSKSQYIYTDPTQFFPEIRNTAFEYDDCLKCLSTYEDAYFCSTADAQSEMPDGMTEEYFLSLNKGWCCGDYDII